MEDKGLDDKTKKEIKRMWELWERVIKTENEKSLPGESLGTYLYRTSKGTNCKKVLFSGRFDPPHPGHIATAIRLEKKYGSVLIVILDYPEREYPVQYAQAIFEECLEKYNISVRNNTTHFAELELEEWKTFNCNLYAGGNLQVNRHIESLGIDTIYVDRAYDYSARNYKKPLE